MKIDSLHKNKKIKATLFIMTLGLVILFVLFRIGSYQTIKILKSKITALVEQNSDLDFQIANIKLNIFSSVVMEGISLHDEIGNAMLTHSIKIRYHLFDMIFKKTDIIDNIRSITIHNLDLTLIEPNLTNRISMSRDLSHIKISLYDSQIQIKSGKNKIQFKNVNGPIKFVNTNTLFAKFSGDVYSQIFNIKTTTSGHLSFLYNVKTGHLNLDNYFRNFSINKSHVDSITCHVDMTTNTLTITKLNIDDSFFGTIHIEPKKKAFRLQGKFHQFSLSSYFPNYFINGNIAIYKKNQFSFSSFLSIQNKTQNDKWFIKIDNNKILKLTRTQNKKRTIQLIYNKQKKQIVGQLKQMKIHNFSLSSKFTIFFRPQSSLLYFNYLTFQNQSLLQNYKLYFYNQIFKTIIKSQHGRVYGIINKKNFYSSFFHINLNKLTFPWKIQEKQNQLTLNGNIHLTPKKFLLKKSSIHLNKSIIIDFLSLNYNVSASSLTFYIAKNKLWYSGLLLFRQNKISLNSTFYHNKQQDKIESYAWKENRRWGFSINLNNKNIGNGWLNDKGYFKQKFFFANHAPYTKFNCYFYGDINNITQMKGYGNGYIKNFKTKVIKIPKINFSFILKGHQNLAFKFFLTDQYNKKLTGNGTLTAQKAMALNFQFLNNITLQWTKKQDHSSLFFRANNFNLKTLEGLLQKNQTLSGYLNSKISTKINSTVWNIEGKIKTFRFNKYSVQDIFWNATYKKKKLKINNISFIDKKGKLLIEKGLLSFLPQKTLFSSFLNYSFTLKQNIYSGMLQITGENSSKKLRLRSDFLNTTINNFFIEQYSQFVSYNKKTRWLKLFTDSYGLTGKLQFGNQYNIKNLSLAFKTKKSDLFNITGSISSKKNLNLNINKISIDVSYIKYLSNAFKSASGVIMGDLRIKGSQKDPKIYGQLKIDTKKLKLAEGIRHIRSLYGTILFNGDTSELDMHALISKKPVQLQGTLTYQNLSLSDYRLNLSMKTNDFIYIKSFNDIQGYANINLLLTKNENNLPVYSGKIYIQKMDFTFPFSGTFQEKSKTKEQPIYLDLKITALKNTHYFQSASSIDIDLKPNSFLDLTGIFANHSREHQLTGKITMEKGEIEYLGTPFKIEKGILLFSEEYSPDIPYLTLRATTKIQQENEKYYLYLEANGLLDENLKPNIYAIPSLTKREILKLLDYGQLYTSISLQGDNQTNEINVETSKEQELDKLFVAGFLTYFDQAYKKILIKPVERRIKKILNLDKVEIKSKFSKNIIEKGLITKTDKTHSSLPTYSVYDAINNSQIILGKYLTDFLFIEYMFSLRKEDYLGNPNIIPQHQLGLELDLKNLTFEWRYEPTLLYNLQKQNLNNEIELKWQKTF